MSNLFLSVDSNKVIFKKNKEQSFHSGTIILNNLVNKFTIFKIFINKNRLYRASPSEGYVAPHSNASVTIKRTSSELTTNEKPDQFLIVAFVTDKLIHNVINIKLLINNILLD